MVSAFWLSRVFALPGVSVSVLDGRLVSQRRLGLLSRSQLVSKATRRLPTGFPTYCASGALAPLDGNLANNQQNQEVCILEESYAPILPQSLNVIAAIAVMTAATFSGTFTTTWTNLVLTAPKRLERRLYPGLLRSSTPGNGNGGPTGFGPLHFYCMHGSYEQKCSCWQNICFVASHVMFAFRNIPLLPPLLMLSFACTLSLSTVWPSLPHLVPDETKATAIGLMTCIQSLGLTVAQQVRRAAPTWCKYFLFRVVNSFSVDGGSALCCR